MTVPGPFTLRPLVSDDLAAAHGLSQAVRWPHRLEDWRLMFGLGHGVVAVDAAGTVIGVAMWWPFGPEAATLGMVIVSPDLQRSGLGRRMLDALVAAAGARRIGLVATGPRACGSTRAAVSSRPARSPSTTARARPCRDRHRGRGPPAARDGGRSRHR